MSRAGTKPSCLYRYQVRDPDSRRGSCRRWSRARRSTRRARETNGSRSADQSAFQASTTSRWRGAGWLCPRRGRATARPGCLARVRPQDLHVGVGKPRRPEPGGHRLSRLRRAARRIGRVDLDECLSGGRAGLEVVRPPSWASGRRHPPRWPREGTPVLMRIPRMIRRASPAVEGAVLLLSASGKSGPAAPSWIRPTPARRACTPCLPLAEALFPPFERNFATRCRPALCRTLPLMARRPERGPSPRQGRLPGSTRRMGQRRVMPGTSSPRAAPSSRASTPFVVDDLPVPCKCYLLAEVVDVTQSSCGSP